MKNSGLPTRSCDDLRSPIAGQEFKDWPALNQIVCALRFFYGVTLGQATMPERIAYAREPSKLPVVLSADEIVRFLEAIASLKSRTALTTVYAAGLRVSEVVLLKIADIDSQRMVIRVEQGKGGKDRFRQDEHGCRSRRAERLRDADLLCLPGHPLAEDSYQQPAGADHEGDSPEDPCCWSVPRRPVMPQPGGRAAALHRRHRMVRQMLHEHATSLSAAGHANRSHRLIKCAKDSGHYFYFARGSIRSSILIMHW